MRLQTVRVTGVAMAAPASLAGCGGATDDHSPPARGRFVGIGVYSAGQLWPKMVASPAKDAGRATTADDEHIIVVVDSQTGEVRECGDYSGTCASLNPWTRVLGDQQIAPVRLTKHAADLAAEQRPAANQAR